MKLIYVLVTVVWEFYWLPTNTSISLIVYYLQGYFWNCYNLSGCSSKCSGKLVYEQYLSLAFIIVAFFLVMIITGVIASVPLTFDL